LSGKSAGAATPSPAVAEPVTQRLRTRGSIRSRIMWLSAALLALLVAVLGGFAVYLGQQQIEYSRERLEASLRYLVADAVQGTYTFYGNRARANLASPGVKEAIRDQDIDRLRQLISGRYEVLSSENAWLRVMHLHAADGRSLLRAHLPEESGDDIAALRPMLARLHESHLSVFGAEWGREGFLLRVAMPAFVEGVYVGGLEFGVDPRYVLDRIRETFGVSAFIRLVGGAEGEHFGLPAPRCAGVAWRLCLRDVSLPKAVLEAAPGTWLRHGGRVLLLHEEIPLRDATGVTVASLQVVQEMTAEVWGFRWTVAALIGSGLGLSVLMGWLIWRTVGRLGHRIEAEQRRMTALADGLGEGVFALNAHGEVEFCNPAAAQLLGYDGPELLGRQLHDLIHHTDAQGRPIPAEECPTHRAAALRQPQVVDDDLFWRADGTALRVGYISTPVRAWDGSIGSITVFHDAGVRLARELALRREVEVFRHGPVVVFSWGIEEGWPVRAVSPSVAQWGYDPQQLVSGLVQFSDLVHPQDRTHGPALIRAALAAGQSELEMTYRLRHGDGHWIWVREHTVIRVDRDGQAREADGYLVEVTEIKQAQLDAEAQRAEVDQLNLMLRDEVRKVRSLSETDALTGLANRMRFDAVLRMEIERSHRYGTPLSLMLIDIDRFKQVNDRYGHPTGDRVLEALASRLRSMLRGSDLLARWGGEEFALITPTGIEGAERLAEKLRAGVEAEPLVGLSSLVTISVGVVECRCAVGESAEALFRRVDRALYAAKEAGRNRVVVDPPPSVASALADP